MMNKSAIDWTDFSWNPVTGCNFGCEYCYARRQATRFAGNIRMNMTSEQLKTEAAGLYVLEQPFKNYTGAVLPFPAGFAPTFHKYRLGDPAKKKKPANIFVCSMADLFGDWIPDEWSGTALTFGQGSTADGFRRILNGSHTIQITASDGKESTSLNATFTKKVTSATVTLTTPLAVDGDITVAVLQVTGSIPEDATFKAEVTNNANDPSPVWQDVTTEVQKGVNIVFSNKTAAKGAAFNFRVSVSRGASGTGGYIEAISGAFQ